MLDDFVPTPVSFLVASFIAVSLFRRVASLFKRDPLVSPISFNLSSPIDLDHSQLDAIPTVGFSDPILSYFTALRFVFDCLPMIEQGYKNVITSVLIILPLFLQLLTFSSLLRRVEVYSRLPDFGGGRYWLRVQK